MLYLDEFNFSVARLIYAPSVFHVAEGIGVDVAEKIARLRATHEHDVYFYPDGAIELSSRAAVEMFEISVGSRVRQHAFNISVAKGPLHDRLTLGASSFHSLSHFLPRCEYILTVCGGFLEKLEAGRVLVRTSIDPWGTGHPHSRADNLPVTVIFKKRISKDFGQQLAALVKNWLIAGRVPDEGRVTLASPELKMTNKIAQMRFDFSAAGNHSVNSLILALIELANSNPITDIYFLPTPNSDETFEERFDLDQYPTMCISLT